METTANTDFPCSHSSPTPTKREGTAAIPSTRQSHCKKAKRSLYSPIRKSNKGNRRRNELRDESADVNNDALELTNHWTIGILPGSNGHSATCKYEFRSKKEVRLFLGKIEDTHGNDGGYKFLRKFNDTIRISLRDDHAKKKGLKLHLMLCDQSSLFASSYLHMSINVSSCSKDTQKDTFHYCATCKYEFQCEKDVKIFKGKIEDDVDEKYGAYNLFKLGVAAATGVNAETNLAPELKDGVTVQQSGRTPRGQNIAKLTLTPGILRTCDANPKTNSAPDLEGSLSAQSRKTPQEPNKSKQKTVTANASIAPGMALGIGESNSVDPEQTKRKRSRKQRKRKRKKKGQDLRTSEKIHREKPAGALLVYNKTETTKAGINERTCLPDAVVALLPAERREHVLLDMVECMPAEGDTTIEQMSVPLGKHGVYLEPVTNKYNKNGGFPLHLLQEKDCSLIVHMKLVNLKGEAMFHFVAWNGKLIIDHPQSSKVNDTTDRENKKNSKLAFGKLYPETKFLSWQITGVYQVNYRTKVTPANCQIVDFNSDNDQSVSNYAQHPCRPSHQPQSSEVNESIQRPSFCRGISPRCTNSYRD